MRKLVAVAMSAEECENIAAEYDPQAVVRYEGGVVTVRLPPKDDYVVCENIVDFAAIYRKMFDSGLSDYAVAIYEQGYQCFAPEYTVIVIDDVSDGELVDGE